MIFHNRFCIILALLILLLPHQSFATAKKPLYIASASNFTDTLSDIVALYKINNPEVEIKITSGSTVSLYEQISNGDSFDVFFSSDVKHADLLFENGSALKDGFIYAQGQLVLWYPNHDIKDSGLKVLQKGDFEHLAIAKYQLSAYGIAAQEVLSGLKLQKKMESKLVYSQNVAGVMKVMVNGTANLGFVSLAQMVSWQKKKGENLNNEIWLVEQNLYKPISQKAVVINGGNEEAAEKFLNFVSSKEIQKVIRNYGYK